MELQTLSFDKLFFPRKEWRWLRAPIETDVSEPDAFLWAAKVADKLWAWHPRGAEPTGGDTCKILVLETDGTEKAAHGLYLKTSFTALPAHDAEWVAALQVLSTRLGHDPVTAGMPPHWDAALRACGLEPHLGVLAQRARYSFLAEEELALLFGRRWDLATFELLEALDAKLRTLFFSAVKRWNLSGGHAKECLGFVVILARKLGEKAATKLTENSYGNAEEFRMALFRTAQPEMATLQQKRIEMLRALRVPARSSVYGDPTFEKDLLKLTHTPRNLRDFEAFRDWINEPDVAEQIRMLLEIYQS